MVALTACGIAAVFCLNAVRDVLAIAKPNQAITVTIPKGADTKAIGQILKDDGIIQYPFVFELVAKFEKYTTFQSGTHILNSNMDYMTLMKSMQAPKSPGRPSASPSPRAFRRPRSPRFWRKTASATPATSSWPWKTPTSISLTAAKSPTIT